MAEGARNLIQLRHEHQRAADAVNSAAEAERAASKKPDPDADKMKHDPAPEHFKDGPEDCTMPLVGSRNRRFISDEAITASSSHGEDSSEEGPPVRWTAASSRMDNALSCWLAGVSDEHQWIQWDFGRPKKINIIQTKGRLLRGRAEDRQMVTEYELAYSCDGTNWTWMPQAFPGNEVRFFTKENKLEPPIIAQWLRLHPTKWHSQIALRVEILGCDPDSDPAEQAINASTSEDDVLATEPAGNGSALTPPCGAPAPARPAPVPPVGPLPEVAEAEAAARAAAAAKTKYLAAAEREIAAKQAACRARRERVAKQAIRARATAETAAREAEAAAEATQARLHATSAAGKAAKPAVEAQARAAEEAAARAEWLALQAKAARAAEAAAEAEEEATRAAAAEVDCAAADQLAAATTSMLPEAPAAQTVPVAPAAPLEIVPIVPVVPVPAVQELPVAMAPLPPDPELATGPADCDKAPPLLVPAVPGGPVTTPGPSLVPWPAVGGVLLPTAPAPSAELLQPSGTIDY